jgi:uncharacterized damage-inducible protein DinB
MSDRAELIAYVDKVHERTMRVARCVPPEQLEWAHAEGKFTLGDLMRHIASLNRFMFAETAQGRPSRYPGHGKELAEGFDAVIAFMEETHGQTMAILRGLSDEQFASKCTTPGGAELRVAKWIRSMIEHEVHHRGQIYVYLSMLGVPSPPLYGLTEEEVKRRSS